MTRIGLISDTHGYLDEAVFEHFKNCDEIWHAGDFGASPQPSPLRVEGVLEELSEDNSEGNTLIIKKSYGDLFSEKFKKINKKEIVFRGVYGNIDGSEIRNIYPEKLFFTVENVNVFIIHIGGYPGRYSKGVKEVIIAHKSQLFISGHSHILKIIFDDKLQCLHMNAGAAGRQGWHKIRTLIRFTIDGKDMKDCEVIELN